MEKKIRKEIKYSSDEWDKVIELSAKSGKLPAAYIRDKALNIKISVIDYLNHHPRDQDERFRLSNKMNDIAKNVNTEKAIYGKDVEEAERVINDLGEFVRNGIIPLPLREVQFDIVNIPLHIFLKNTR